MDSDTSESTESGDSQNARNHQLNERQVEELLICLKIIIKNVVLAVKKNRKSDENNKAVREKNKQTKATKFYGKNMANKEGAGTLRNNIEEFCSKINHIGSSVSSTKAVVPETSRSIEAVVPKTSRSRIEAVTPGTPIRQTETKVPTNSSHTIVPGTSRSHIEAVLSQTYKRQTETVPVSSNHTVVTGTSSQTVVLGNSRKRIETEVPAASSPTLVPGNFRRQTDTEVPATLTQTVVPGTSRKQTETEVPAASRPTVMPGISERQIETDGPATSSRTVVPGTSRSQTEPEVPATSSHIKAVLSKTSTRQTETEVPISSNHTVIPGVSSYTVVTGTSRMQTEIEAPATSIHTVVPGTSRSHIEAVIPSFSMRHTETEEPATSSHTVAPGTLRTQTVAEVPATSSHTIVSATLKNHSKIIEFETSKNSTDSEVSATPRSHTIVPGTSSHSKTGVSGTSKSQTRVLVPGSSRSLSVAVGSGTSRHTEAVVPETTNHLKGAVSETLKSHTETVEPRTSRSQTGADIPVTSKSNTVVSKTTLIEAIVPGPPKNHSETAVSVTSRNQTKAVVPATTKSHTAEIMSEPPRSHMKAEGSGNLTSLTKTVVPETPKSHTEAVVPGTPSSHSETIVSETSKSHTEVRTTSRSDTEIVVPRTTVSNIEIKGRLTGLKRRHSKTVDIGNSNSQIKTVVPETSKSYTDAATSRGDRYAVVSNNTKYGNEKISNTPRQKEEAKAASRGATEVASITSKGHGETIVPDALKHLLKKKRKKKKKNLKHDKILSNDSGKKRRKIQEINKESEKHTISNKTKASENVRQKLDSALTTNAKKDSRENIERRDKNVKLQVHDAPKASTLSYYNPTDKTNCLTAKGTNSNFKRKHAPPNGGKAKRAKIYHKCIVCYKSFHNDDIEEHYKEKHYIQHEIKHNREHYEHKIQDLDNRFHRRTSKHTNINQAKNNEELKGTKQLKTTTNIAPKEPIEQTSANLTRNKIVNNDRITNSMENGSIICDDNTVDLTRDENDELELLTDKAVACAVPIENGQVIDLCVDAPEDRNVKNNWTDLETNNNIESSKSKIKAKLDIARAEALLAINVKKEEATYQKDDNVVSNFFNTQPSIWKSSEERKYKMIKNWRKLRNSRTGLKYKMPARRNLSKGKLDNHLQEINTEKQPSQSTNDVSKASVPGSTSAINQPTIEKHPRSTEKHSTSNIITVNASQSGLSIRSTPNLSNWKSPPPTHIRQCDSLIASADLSIYLNPSTITSEPKSSILTKSPSRKSNAVVSNPQNSSKQTANTDTRLASERDATSKSNQKHENKSIKIQNTVPISNDSKLDTSKSMLLTSSEQRSTNPRALNPIQSAIKSSTNVPSSRTHLISSLSPSAAVSKCSISMIPTTALPSKSSQQSSESRLSKPIQQSVAEKPAVNLPTFTTHSKSSPSTSVTVSNSSISMPPSPTVPTKSKQKIEPRLPKPAQQSVPKTGYSLSSSTIHLTSTPKATVTLPSSKPNPFTPQNSSNNASRSESRHSVPEISTNSSTSHFNSTSSRLRSPSTDTRPTQSNSVSTSSRRASMTNITSNPKDRQCPQTSWHTPVPADIRSDEGTLQNPMRAPPVLSRPDLRISVSNSGACPNLPSRPILTPRLPSAMLGNQRTPTSTQATWHIPEIRPGIDKSPHQIPAVKTRREDRNILEYLTEAGSRDPRILKRFAAAYGRLEHFF